MLDNLKEPSKLFPLKTDNFENVQLRVSGKRFSMAMNRSNIPEDVVKGLLVDYEEEEANKEEEEYLL